MATCFALTFQSIVLDDGMAEFMTFCRGIALVSMQMHYKGVKFLFSNLQHLDTSAILKPHMDALPLVRRDWVDMAVAAIRGLEPLCTQPVEFEYYRIILEIAEALYTDSYLGRYPKLALPPILSIYPHTSTTSFSVLRFPWTKYDLGT